MAVKLGDMYWNISANTSDMEKKTDSAGKKAEKTAKKAESMSKKMQLAFKAIAGAAVIQLGKKLYGELIKLEDAYQVQERAVGKLEATMKSLGTFSKTASKDFQDFASEMQGITNVGDETTLSILATAQSMGLSAEESKEATREALGLAGAFDIDLQRALKLVVEKNNGVTEGFNRLIPSVRGLTDENDKLAKINEVVANSFSVTAEMADDSLGVQTRLNNTWGDTQEVLGGVVTQGLTPFRVAIESTLAQFNEWASGTTELEKSTKELGTATKTYNGLMATYKTRVSEATDAERELLELQLEGQKARIQQSAVEVFTGYEEGQQAIAGLRQELEDAKESAESSGEAFAEIDDKTKQVALSMTPFEILLHKIGLGFQLSKSAGLDFKTTNSLLNDATLKTIDTYDTYEDALKDIPQLTADIAIAEIEQKNRIQELAVAYNQGLIDLTEYKLINEELYDTIIETAEGLKVAEKETKALTAKQEKLAEIAELMGIKYSASEQELRMLAERMGVAGAEALSLEEIFEQLKDSQAEQAEASKRASEEAQAMVTAWTMQNDVGFLTVEQFRLLAGELGIVGAETMNLVELIELMNQKLSETGKTAGEAGTWLDALTDKQKIAMSNIQTSISSAGGYFGSFMESVASGEDVWDTFAKSALLALADVVQALGVQLAAEAAILWAKALFTVGGSVPFAIAATAGSIAAFAGAGLIRGLAGKFYTGGIVPGKPTGTDDRVALVSGGEEVLREDDPRHVYNRSEDLQIYINLDGRQISETVVEDYVNRGIVLIDGKRGVLA